MRQPEIVVIEDDPALLDLVRELLTIEGFVVRDFAAAEPGWAALQAHRPDALLLDLQLGAGPDGWTVLDRLVLNPRTRDIPVVLMTSDARALEQHAPVLRPEHGVHVLPKPFDVHRLLETIHVARRSAAPSPAVVSAALPEPPRLRLVPSSPSI